MAREENNNPTGERFSIHDSGFFYFMNKRAAAAKAVVTVPQVADNFPSDQLTHR